MSQAFLWAMVRRLAPYALGAFGAYLASQFPSVHTAICVVR